MGEELVTDSTSETEESGGSKSHLLSSLRYSEIFDKYCSYYMSIGMSYQDYWDGDPEMVKYFREAHEKRIDMRNEELWLQGFYIYEALADVSPLFNPMNNRKKAYPYREKPIPLTKAKIEAEEKAEKEKRILAGREAMRAMMISFNQKFAKKEVKNGRE